MKTLRKITAALLAILMLFSFAACKGGDSDNSEDESTTSYIREVKTKLAVPGGGAFELATVKFSEDRSYAYDVQFVDDVNKIASMLEKGEIDMAGLPLDAAVKLINSVGGIKIMAVNTLASFEIIDKTENVKAFSDLKGKTVYISKEEPMAEFVLSYILGKNGVDIKDVKLEFVATNAELKALATEEKIDILVISNPHAAEISFANEKMKKVFDLTDEWNKHNETKLAYNVILAREEYVKAHPDYMEKFLSQIETTINYAQDVNTMSGDYFKEKGYYDEDILILGAVSSSNLVFGKGERMKETIDAVLKAVHEIKPEIIGGKLPAADVYYIA